MAGMKVNSSTEMPREMWRFHGGLWGSPIGPETPRYSMASPSQTIDLAHYSRNGMRKHIILNTSHHMSETPGIPGTLHAAGVWEKLTAPERSNGPMIESN